MGCSSSHANDSANGRPRLEKETSLQSISTARRTDREQSIGDSTTDNKLRSKVIAYILRAGICNKPGIPLYVNVFSSNELSQHDMVVEKHTTWDNKMPGAIVHSVLISMSLRESIRVDSSYRVKVFDAIFRYLDMIYPNVLIDDTNLAIVKIAKDFAGDDENELKWFPRNLPPIDISQLL